jgi:hypothetical protein
MQRDFDKEKLFELVKSVQYYDNISVVDFL